MTRKETGKRRSRQLDALRALSVTAVLYTHFWNDHNSIGVLGIQLFFIISGYLITGILLHIRQLAEVEGADVGLALRNFYVRRALRIWPVYYGSLAIALLIEQQRLLHTLPWHMIFASNFLFASRNAWDPWFTSHFWSLSVEEQFYLLWPPFILFFPRPWLRSAIVVIVLTGIAFNILATILRLDNPGIAVLLPGALDALGVGAILALAGPWKWPTWLSYTGAAAAIFWVIANMTSLAGDTLDRYAVALSNELVLVAMAAVALSANAEVGGVIGKVLNSNVLGYIGRISYGIYVYHFIVLGLGLTFLPDYFERGLFQFVFMGAATVAAAALSWAFIEKPILSLKDNFPYRAMQPSPA